MLLSIVTVSKGNFRGLIETLTSIVNQLKHTTISIEWILVTADPKQEVKNFISNIDIPMNFSVLFDNSNGIFSAMNQGIQSAIGEYILFLNSGDIFFDEFVLQNLEYTFKNNNEKKIIAGNVELCWKELRSVSNLEPWVCHQASFLPKELIKNELYDEDLNFYGDLDLWMKLKLDNNFKIKRVDLVIATFVMGGVGNSPENLLRRLNERNKLDIRYKESYFKQILRTFYSFSLILVWKIFGEDYYYRFIMK